MNVGIELNKLIEQYGSVRIWGGEMDGYWAEVSTFYRTRYVGEAATLEEAIKDLHRAIDAEESV